MQPIQQHQVKQELLLQCYVAGPASTTIPFHHDVSKCIGASLTIYITFFTKVNSRSLCKGKSLRVGVRVPGLEGSKAPNSFPVVPNTRKCDVKASAVLAGQGASCR